MWRSIYYILFGSIIVFLAACSKDVKPDDISPVPVFNAIGTLEGAPFSMEAGEEDLYMFTFVREEADGTIAYGGRIEKENCQNDCGEALEILLLDTLPFIQSEGETRVWSQLASAMFQGSVVNDNLRCKMKVQNLSSSHFGGLKEETWTFNNSCQVKGKMEEDYYYFPSNGTILTRLEVHDNVGNKASIQKSLYYGYSQPDCGLTMKVEMGCPGKIRLKVDNPHDFDNLDYKWSNGSTDESICVHIVDSVEYSVTVTDQMNRVTILRNGFKKIGFQLSYINADFRFLANASTFKMEDAWPRIAIRYRNESGVWYDSRNTMQDEYCDYFSLKKLEPYLPNYQGLTTKKANMFFSVKLANDQGETIDLEHFNVNFGFGSRQ